MGNINKILNLSKNGYKKNSPDVNKPFNVIPSNEITMIEDDGTPLKKGPILGIGIGNGKVIESKKMMPGKNYKFSDNVTHVIEEPLQLGGQYTPKERMGVRQNPDGSVSSHLMMSEVLPNGNWVSFPSLFQNEDGSWVDMSEKTSWYPIYLEALKRGEVYNFGKNKEAALEFGRGSWKKEYQQGGSIPKFQIAGEKYPNLFNFDPTPEYVGYQGRVPVAESTRVANTYKPTQQEIKATKEYAQQVGSTAQAIRNKTGVSQKEAMQQAEQVLQANSRIQPEAKAYANTKEAQERDAYVFDEGMNARDYFRYPLQFLAGRTPTEEERIQDRIRITDPRTSNLDKFMGTAGQAMGLAPEALINTGVGLVFAPSNFTKLGMVADAVSPIGNPFHPDFIKSVNQAGEYLTTQTPLKYGYKLNPKALKDKDVEILQRWHFDNQYNKYLPSGTLDPKYTGRFYTSNWDNSINKKRLNTGVPGYMHIRPGSGEIRTAIVRKGSANLPQELLTGPGSKDIVFDNIERILPENIPYTTKRIEKNPFDKIDIMTEDGDINPDYIKARDEMLKIAQAEEPKPHWWKGYELPETPTSPFNTRAQNDLLVEQARRSGEAPLPDYMEPYISRRYTPAAKEQDIFESFLSPEKQAELRKLRTQTFNPKNQYKQGGSIPKFQIAGQKRLTPQELIAAQRAQQLQNKQAQYFKDNPVSPTDEFGNKLKVSGINAPIPTSMADAEGMIQRKEIIPESLASTRAKQARQAEERKQERIRLQEEYAKRQANPEYSSWTGLPGESWRETLAAEGAPMEAMFRFSNEDNFFDDYINPAAWIGYMAKSLGEAPLQAKKTDSYLPYVTSIGMPLLGGAAAGIGAKTTGQFINNAVNPFAGMGDHLTTQTPLKNTWKLNPKALKEAPLNTLYHGSNNPNLQFDDIIFTDVNPNVGARPGQFKKKAVASGNPLELPGGFYTNDLAVPSFMGDAPYRYSMNVPANAKVFEWTSGISDNISVKKLQELKNKGYDIIKGKNIIGQTEYIPLNRDIISNWTKFEKGAPELEAFKNVRFETQTPHWLRGYSPAKVEELIPVLRVAKPGQLDETLNFLRVEKKAKELGVESLTVKELEALSKFIDINKTSMAGTGYGQGFTSAISDLGYYAHPNIRKTRGYTEEPELFRTYLTKTEADKYSVTKFKDYATAAENREFLLPLEKLENVERFKFSDYDRLIDEFVRFKKAINPNYKQGGSITKFQTAGQKYPNLFNFDPTPEYVGYQGRVPVTESTSRTNNNYVPTQKEIQDAIDYSNYVGKTAEDIKKRTGKSFTEAKKDAEALIQYQSQPQATISKLDTKGKDKNLVFLDNAGDAKTIGDYANTAWGVVTNPIDAVTASMSPGGFGRNFYTNQGKVEALMRDGIIDYDRVQSNPMMNIVSMLPYTVPGLGQAAAMKDLYEGASAMYRNPTAENAAWLALDYAGARAGVSPASNRLLRMKTKKALGNAYKYIPETLKEASFVPMYRTKKPGQIQSEIDWGKWNSNIPKRTDLMKEYAEIERKAKADGTWMKDSRGNPARLPNGELATPEQWVQSQSKAWEKSYGSKGFENLDETYIGKGNIGNSDEFPPTLRESTNPLYGKSIMSNPDGNMMGYYTHNSGMSPAKDWSLKDLLDKFKITASNITDGPNYPIESPFRKIGIHQLILPKSKNTLSFDAKQAAWNTIDNPDIYDKVKALDSKIEGEFPGEKLVSTDMLARYLDHPLQKEYNRVSIKNVDDAGPGQWGEVLINKQEPGNYYKSLWGNVGDFDLSNPNIYKSLAALVALKGVGASGSTSSNEYKQGGYINNKSVIARLLK